MPLCSFPNGKCDGSQLPRVSKKKICMFPKSYPMEKLDIFNSLEFGEMRTHCDPNTGEVWFCLADVCKALDIKNPRDAKTTLTNKGLISLNVRELDNTVATTDGIPTEEMRGNPNMTFIDEGNLYQVIFQSRKPNAVKFKEWICYNVIPSIRKHGAYITKDVLNDDRKLNDAIQAIKEEYREKIDFADAFLSSEDSAYVAVFADYLTKNGVKMGRNQLFKWFKDKKVLVMHGDEYFPSARYMKMGLFDLEASAISKGNGRKKISHTVKITPKGMRYFLDKIADRKNKNTSGIIEFSLFS